MIMRSTASVRLKRLFVRLKAGSILIAILEAASGFFIPEPVMCGPDTNPLQPVFYASFDDSSGQGSNRNWAIASAFTAQSLYGHGEVFGKDFSKPILREDGIAGACAQIPPVFSYDAVANVSPRAGTISFYIRRDEELQPNSASDQMYLLSVSTIENRVGYYDFLLVAWEVERGNIGIRVQKQLDELTQWKFVKVGKMEIGRWYHVTVAWDECEGYSLYLDGREIVSSPELFLAECHADQVGLACFTTPKHIRPNPNSIRMSVDEFKIYDRSLEGDQVRNIISNKPISSASTVFDARRAQQRLASLGWNNTAGIYAADLDRNSSVTIRNICAIPGGPPCPVFDGLNGTSWSSSEERTIPFALARAGDAFNALAVVGRADVVLERQDGNSWQTITHLQSGEKYRSARLLEQDCRGGAEYRLRFSNEVAEIVLNHYSSTGNGISGRNEAPLAARLVRIWDSLRGSRVPLPDADQNNAGQMIPLVPRVADELSEETRRFTLANYRSWDRNILTATGAEEGATKYLVPELRAVHFVLPASGSDRFAGGIVLKLVFARPPSGCRMAVTLRDPVDFRRALSSADLKLEARRGKEMRLELGVSGFIIPANRDLVATVFFDQPQELVLGGTNPSAMALKVIEAKEAEAGVVAYNLNIVRRLHSLLSEPRPWNQSGVNRKVIRWLDELLTRAELLHRYYPGAPGVETYYEATHPAQAPAKVSFESPPGWPAAPVWAIEQEYAARRFRDEIHWWINCRQQPSGLFADINDDTDLVQDWPGVILMCGADAKISESFGRLAEYVWERAITNGLNRQFTDVLHAYEEGINIPPAAFLMNFGDPIWFERMMATVARFDFLTGLTPAGRRHFKSNWFSSDRLGAPVDSGSNALMMQPAIYLAWYSRHPQAVRYLGEWVKAWTEQIDHGKNPGVPAGFNATNGAVRGYGYFLSGLGMPNAVWAAHKFTGNQEYLASVEKIIKPALANARKIGAMNYALQSFLPTWRFYTLNPIADAEILDVVVNLPPARGYSMFDGWLYFNEGELLPWYISGDRAALDNALYTPAAVMKKYFPLFTEAYPKQDRARLPQLVVQRTRLGGVAYHRNCIDPDFAVSWEGDVRENAAMLVLERGTERLDVVVCNLSAAEKKIGMRVWELAHGRYDVSQGPVNPDLSWIIQPAKPESIAPAPFRSGNGGIPPEGSVGTACASMELARNSLVQLTVPAHSLWRIRAVQSEQLDPIEKRPDLAVTASDGSYSEADKAWVIRVHNIGAVAATQVVVRVECSGKIVTNAVIAQLEAPLDLLPRIVEVRVPAGTESTNTAVSIAIDPDNKIHEINESNNQCLLNPYRTSK